MNFYLEANELIFLSIFSLFDFFPLPSEGTGAGNRTSTTMPRGMHVHLLDFNEHAHSEDSMPRGVCMHSQKCTCRLPKNNPQQRKKAKEMTKTR